MKSNLIYKNSIHKKNLNLKLKGKLKKEYLKIFEKLKINLNIPNNSFYSLSKKFKLNFNFSDLRRFKKFKTIAIIGMGGSILGTEAIYNFFQDKIKKEFIFFDDINEIKIKNFQKKYKQDQVLFFVISKSGNTLETLSNFFSLKILKKKSKNIILISEKGSNPIFLLSNKMKLFHVESKKFIGGRYSVLSEVGLLPAYIMGLNISNLRKNLLIHFKKKNRNFLKESSTLLATLIDKKKFNDLILINYVPELEKFLYWYQQLFAESLGKNKKGFLPLVSNTPKDHHSLMQLYLDGPKNKIFYIFSTIKKQNKKINSEHLDKKLSYLKNKNLSQIKNAQKNAFMKILKKKKIPFREFVIRDFDEKTLGELFSYFMLETAMIGKLLSINPYDQPAVEELKVFTKRFLI